MIINDEVYIKYGVTVTIINDKGKIDQVFIETDSLLGASRIINTFKPKRGYRVVEFLVQESSVLIK